MESRGGRTKIPSPDGGRGFGADAADSPDGGPTYFVPTDWDYGANAAPGEEGRRRAFFARRDELDLIAKMLVRRHGFDPGRARAIVWGQPGLIRRLLSQKGRPPKPHLLQAADTADQIQSTGKEIPWSLVHRSVVALNEPQESRAFEYRGER